MRFLSVVLLAACAAAKPQFPVLEDITKSLEDITKGLEKAVAEIANAGAQIGEGFEEAGVDLGKTLDEVNADVVESIEKALNDPNNPLKVSESCIQKIFKI
jgi:phage-related protein